LFRSFFLVFLLAVSGIVTGADEIDRRLLRVGIDLFPSLLSADLDIDKKLGRKNELTILLVYQDDRSIAEETRIAIGKFSSIRKHAVRVVISDGTDLERYLESPPAGIFVVERGHNRLDAIVDFSLKTNRIVFSPYAEDLKQGVLGSIYVSDRILPEINSLALKDSRIRIKSFFLKVARLYE
jgi:hypothetical protein